MAGVLSRSQRLKRRRRWVHSAFTTAALARAIDVAGTLGIEWGDLRKLARSAAGADAGALRVALMRLRPPPSDRILALQGVSAIAADFSEFDLGRLSLLLELMDAEREAPDRLLASGVYSSGQSAHDGRVELYDPNQIGPRLERAGYFDERVKNPQRKAMRWEVIQRLRLQSEGTRDPDGAVDKGVKRAAKKWAQKKGLWPRRAPD